jgi:PhzF family phenazine biosynthesis protein
MQQVAREMRRYKTAFINRTGSTYHLRCFTPTVEIDLSGGGTVAAAHILWETGELRRADDVEFLTRRGAVRARLNNDLIEVVLKTVDETQIDGVQIESSLGIDAEYAGVDPSGTCIVEIDSDQTLKRLRPDVHAVGLMPFRSVVITSKSSSDEFDIVSRVFSPRIGVEEDPASATAHACMAPYWSRKLGKNSFSGSQGLERRGIIHVRLDGDQAYLAGKAFTILDGTLSAS